MTLFCFLPPFLYSDFILLAGASHIYQRRRSCLIANNVSPRGTNIFFPTYCRTFFVLAFRFAFYCFQFLLARKSLSADDILAEPLPLSTVSFFHAGFAVTNWTKSATSNSVHCFWKNWFLILTLFFLFHSLEHGSCGKVGDPESVVDGSFAARKFCST